MSEFRVSESDAARLWRRAAEMQAEAAHRLEARARELGGGKGGGTGGREAPFPEDGYELQEVREAAREAGIHPEYVDRALAELRHERKELSSPPDLVDRMADRLLAGPSGSLVARRLVQAEGKALLTALDRVLTGPGHSLVLVDMDGEDPLTGGPLTFKIPAWSGVSVQGEHFAYRAMWVWSNRLVVSIRPVPEAEGGPEGESDQETGPGDARLPTWEVELLMPLRKGRRVNAWGSVVAAGGLGIKGGILGAAAGTGLAAFLGIPAVLSAAALAAGAGLGIGGSALGGAWLMRLGWRHGAREMENTLEETLGKVVLQVRTGGVFLPPGHSAGVEEGPYGLAGWMGGRSG